MIKSTLPTHNRFDIPMWYIIHICCTFNMLCKYCIQYSAPSRVVYYSLEAEIFVVNKKDPRYYIRSNFFLLAINSLPKLLFLRTSKKNIKIKNWQRWLQRAKIADHENNIRDFIWVFTHTLLRHRRTKEKL